MKAFWDGADYDEMSWKPLQLIEAERAARVQTAQYD